MAIYRVQKSADYVTISNYHLRDKRLRMADKGLMSLLLAGEDGEVYTVAELAELGPEGKDAIYSSLNRLEAAGYIRRRQTHAEDGRFAEVEMLICERPEPAEEASGEDDPSPCREKPYTENPDTAEPYPEKPYTENPDTVAEMEDLELNHRLDTTYSRESVSLKGNKVENNNTPYISPQKNASLPKWRPEMFVRFWEAYPWKVGKQAAAKAWDKLRPDDDTLRQMARGLKSQLRSELWTRGIGIPYPGTWLNQQRWEDDLSRPPRADAIRDDAPDVQIWTPGGVL